MQHYHPANSNTKIPQCKSCDKYINDGVVIYVPSNVILAAYRKIKANDTEAASDFLIANEQHFTAFCIRCWIHQYVAFVAYDSQIPYPKKLTLINEHMIECYDGVAKDILYKWLGVPGWN